MKFTPDAVNLADADRSCFKKRQYWTKNAARDAAARVNKANLAEGDDRTVTPYRCIVCHRFHLSSIGKADHHYVKHLMQRRA